MVEHSPQTLVTEEKATTTDCLWYKLWGHMYEQQIMLNRIAPNPDLLNGE